MQGMNADQELLLELITRGYSNADIADRMAIDEKSVKEHLAIICYRLGITNVQEIDDIRDAIVQSELHKP